MSTCTGGRYFGFVNGGVLPAAVTAKTIAIVQAGNVNSGECWGGGSVRNGEPVIRISVCSWVTFADDINRSVAAFVDARKEAPATHDF